VSVTRVSSSDRTPGLKAGFVLAISVGLNVVLAVTAVRLLRLSSPQSPHPTATRSPVETVRVVTNLPPETTFVTNTFRWRQLESTNYEEYAANLRAVGCPERTLRDIIVAEVWDRYHAAERTKDRGLPFWQNGPRRLTAQRARETELIRLKKDLAAVLQRLFGFIWSPAIDRDPFDDEQWICHALLGDVSDEQFANGLGLLGRVEEANEEVRWQAHDILLDADYAELLRRRDEIERGLHAVLSPTQFEEFRARVGAAERVLGHLFNSDGLDELNPTPNELRQIGLAQTEVWPLGWQILDLDDSETEAAKEAREANMEARLRTILGEERYAEAKLLRDGRYRDIYRFAKENRMSRNTTHRLYEIQKLTREEIRRLRDDKSLNAQERSERVEAVTLPVT